MCPHVRTGLALALAVAVSLPACGGFQLSPLLAETRGAAGRNIGTRSGLDIGQLRNKVVSGRPCSSTSRRAGSGSDEGEDGVDYSADPLTAFLGKFLPRGEKSNPPQAKDLIFNVGEEAKRRGLAAAEMAAAVGDGLRKNGWFVTGRVDASLFSEDFFFSDPQVSLTGVGKYAEGVAKLFNQEESRCDVISSEADGEDIVVQWRLSGRINLPFNPPIKPYVVTTTFERDAEGLLTTQRDEFAIAGWDILLHAVFPGHPFGAAPAPPVQPHDA